MFTLKIPIGYINVTVSMRYHGRLFVIDLSVYNFRNSPNATKKYLRNIEPLLPDNDGEYDGNTDTDTFEWLANIFEPIFSQISPHFAPSFDPGKIGRPRRKVQPSPRQ